MVEEPVEAPREAPIETPEEMPEEGSVSPEDIDPYEEPPVEEESLANDLSTIHEHEIEDDDTIRKVSAPPLDELYLNDLSYISEEDEPGKKENSFNHYFVDGDKMEFDDDGMLLSANLSPE